MGSQVLSSQSPPSFRSTALAFPLFPGSCMRKPFTHDKPETPMPLATASLHPPQPFHFVPAIHPAQHPVTLLPNDQHPAPFRITNPVSPHTSAPLSPPVSADRFLGFWMPCAVARTRCSGVRRALTPSVLVNSAWGVLEVVCCRSCLRFGCMESRESFRFSQAGCPGSRSLRPGIRSAAGGPALAVERIGEAGSWFGIGGCQGYSTGPENRFSQIFFSLLQRPNASAL